MRSLSAALGRGTAERGVVVGPRRRRWNGARAQTGHGGERGPVGAGGRGSDPTQAPALTACLSRAGRLPAWTVGRRGWGSAGGHPRSRPGMSAPSSCWTLWSSGSGSSWTPSPPVKRCCGSWAAGARSRLVAGSVPTRAGPGRWGLPTGWAEALAYPGGWKSVPTAVSRPLTSFHLGERLRKS